MPLQPQRGATFLGLIIGFVLGLSVALAIAIYVTKVPTPFSNKNQTRTNDQDTQEREKNKDWNPNGVFQPKTAAPVPTLQATQTPAVLEPADLTPPKTPLTTPTAAKPPPETPKTEPKPAVTADPLGELVKTRPGLSSPAEPAGQADAFDYLIQVGAYKSSTDADAQKAKLAMMGLEAKVSERDQAGRTIFRVRLGPFPDKVAAERVRTRLQDSAIESALVRIQR